MSLDAREYVCLRAGWCWGWNGVWESADLDKETRREHYPCVAARVG